MTGDGKPEVGMASLCRTGVFPCGRVRVVRTGQGHGKGWNEGWAVCYISTRRVVWVLDCFQSSSRT